MWVFLLPIVMSGPGSTHVYLYAFCGECGACCFFLFSLLLVQFVCLFFKHVTSCCFLSMWPTRARLSSALLIVARVRWAPGDVRPCSSAVTPVKVDCTSSRDIGLETARLLQAEAKLALLTTASPATGDRLSRS